MKHSAIFIDNDDSLFSFLSRELKKIFQPGDRVAIKLHMGEPGNVHYLKPEFTARVISVLKEMDCRPFIFDSPVTYRSPRGSVEGYIRSAAGNGYTSKKVGADIVISDNSVTVEGELMDYKLASTPLEADGVFLLTHFKGHMASGIGGAIKNIGMGCMAKETKGAIHSGGHPNFTGQCEQCGECVESCPTDNIRLNDHGPAFDQSWCCGCSNCVLTCPSGCIEARVATFGELLSEAAVTAHQRYEKFYAVNVLRGITRLCDCVADSGPVVVEDQGFVCGADMLSVDIASVEIIREKTGIEDIFKEHNKTSPWDHIRAAAEMMDRDLDVSIETIP